MTVLAIDPGRGKCGLAVVQPGRVLHREVVVELVPERATTSLEARCRCFREHPPRGLARLVPEGLRGVAGGSPPG